MNDDVGPKEAERGASAIGNAEHEESERIPRIVAADFLYIIKYLFGFIRPPLDF